MGNRHRVPLLAIGALLASTTVVFADPPTPAASVTPTIVTIEWHDGNADQIDVLPILENQDMLVAGRSVLGVTCIHECHRAAWRYHAESSSAR